MKILQFLLLGALVASLSCLWICLKRKREIAAYSTRSLLVFVEEESAVSKRQATELVALMKGNRMDDIGSAMVIFEMKRQSDCFPLQDQELQDFVDSMTKKYYGKDSPMNLLR